MLEGKTFLEPDFWEPSWWSIGTLWSAKMSREQERESMEMGL